MPTEVINLVNTINVCVDVTNLFNICLFGYFWVCFECNTISFLLNIQIVSLSVGIKCLYFPVYGYLESAGSLEISRGRFFWKH